VGPSGNEVSGDRAGEAPGSKGVRGVSKSRQIEEGEGPQEGGRDKVWLGGQKHIRLRERHGEEVKERQIEADRGQEESQEGSEGSEHRLRLELVREELLPGKVLLVLEVGLAALDCLALDRQVLELIKYPLERREGERESQDI
jgi:hypothetical protein